VDADTLIERDALRKLVHGYIHRGSKVIALGGIVRLANDCVMESGQVVEPRLPRNLTAAFQAMEYIRAFLCGRAGWNSLNSLLIISGAFGLFDRKEVINAGGYDAGTVGEDMELIVRLHRIMRENRRPYSVIFLPDPVCWTQAPESLRVLGRQRNRWQSGLIQTLIRHRAMIANPRYGPPGTLGMTYNLLFEALGPVVELSGYVVVAVSWLFGVVSGGFMVLFLMVAVMFGLLLSVGALVLEEFTVKKYSNTEDLLKLLFLALLENFGYRQINAWWRLKAIIDLLRGRVSWGEMERKAFAKQ
ncbi:MAG TPA: glycosyltransferase family 2 protein, partial [bacterium]|nr:glycosyltransferase family 2 protein [bacterium]